MSDADWLAQQLGNPTEWPMTGKLEDMLPYILIRMKSDWARRAQIGPSFPNPGLGTSWRTAFEHRTKEADPAALELPSQFELLSNFVEPGLFNERMASHFIEPRLVQWSLVFDSNEGVSLGEYAKFFYSLDAIYSLMLTVQIEEYFIIKWIRGVDPVLRPKHRLVVLSISKSSPDDAKLQAVEGGFKALGDALSVGKQYQDIRTAGAKVREAKAQARKVELEVEAMERAERLANSIEDDEEAFLKTKKMAEYRALIRQEEEEELKLQKLRRQGMEESLDLLAKAIPVIDKLPEESRKQFLERITSHVEVLQSSPLEIKSYKQLPPPPGPTRPDAP